MTALISKKAASIKKSKVIGFIVLFAIAFLVLAFSYRLIKGSRIPDLSDCSRLEIRYHPSTKYYFDLETSGRIKVPSQDEKEHIQSMDFFTVKDKERIKAFARDVSLGSYGGLHLWGTFKTDRFVSVDCYRDKKNVMSFIVLGNSIFTQDRHRFRYSKGLPNMEILEPPEIHPFKLRFRCAFNLQEIYCSGPLYSREKKVSAYPETTEWCDVIVRDRENTVWMSEEKMLTNFKCPAAGEGKCHYAMNPHCEPNSPPDTVLL